MKRFTSVQEAAVFFRGVASRFAFAVHLYVVRLQRGNRTEKSSRFHMSFLAFSSLIRRPPELCADTKNPQCFIVCDERNCGITLPLLREGELPVRDGAERRLELIWRAVREAKKKMRSIFRRTRRSDTESLRSRVRPGTTPFIMDVFIHDKWM